MLRLILRQTWLLHGKRKYKLFKYVLSYRMNVIDFLKILYHFPAVPSFHFLTPFSVCVHGSRGTQKLVQYFQQLHMETMERFVIVNNESY